MRIFDIPNRTVSLSCSVDSVSHINEFRKKCRPLSGTSSSTRHGLAFRASLSSFALRITTFMGVGYGFLSDLFRLGLGTSAYRGSSPSPTDTVRVLALTFCKWIRGRSRSSVLRCIWLLHPRRLVSLESLNHLLGILPIPTDWLGGDRRGSTVAERQLSRRR